MPFGNGFSGTARLGYAATHQTGSVIASSPTGSAGSNLTANKSDFTYGLGLKYDFTKNTSLRFDLDNYKENNRFNVWTVGVGYAF